MEQTPFVDKETLGFLKRVGETLLSHGLFVGTAESCTGGRIASLITSVPGSSAYFKGGVVSYDNKVKEQVLGVSPVDMEKYGAVSEPVVLQMVKGAMAVLDCNSAVATSGIAGPDGGSADKPVGTVWIAAAVKDKIEARCFLFSGDRQEVIQQSATKALEMLLALIS